MSATLSRDKAIKENFDAFQQILPAILIAHAGKVALLRHCEVADYFDNSNDAVRAGHAQFSDKLFSVQRVERATADLGWYSHV